MVGTLSRAEFDLEVAEIRARVVNEVNELGETALFTATFISCSLVRFHLGLVMKNEFEKAICFLMGGSKEAEEIGRMAEKAVEEGGLSYRNLMDLIEELKGCAFEKKETE
ncbi:hypothetical protein RHSIM_Rhsim06G0053600 [Rhododendron simsii]|uniref:Uncharacterized protein n=1 Tax=Rhododendron simsii TaxID=118357 RepID=A0A834H265_RHOSS|nr:hypothetical protein RHSIM_Rhsim06G0053600 [Rhododendron simsii]